MPVKLPEPSIVARQQAAYLASEPGVIEAILQRVLNDCPFVDGDSLVAGLESFHRERMAKVPSSAKYPESVVWVNHLVTVDRELKRLANLTDRQLAIYRSLGAYLCFRGFAAAKPAMVEKCRVVYVPESDQGQVHIKNVDDPATHWRGMAAPTDLPLNDNLVDDGVGSGLHIDDEPDEIFPLQARNMLQHYADDVPGAVEFYTRYKPFWGGCNVVLRDKQNRSVAIEKCSVNHIEVFKPGPDGISHCSGMACRDANSPQGRYQREKRTKYLTKFGQAVDGPDQTFWDACDRAERMLADGLKKLGKPASFDKLVTLFRTPWPDGLSKEGAKLHPQQSVEEYTLVTHLTLLDKKKYIRWQRDAKTLKMTKEPETFQF